jgi:RNA polymerase sigma-32 factor
MAIKKKKTTKQKTKTAVVAQKAKKTSPRLVKAEIVDPKAQIKLPVIHDDAKALTVADPLTAYLNEVRKYPLLTKEHEAELAKRYYETGDAKAAELLATSNLRFVVKIAAEYSKFGSRMIDLVQEGNVGLLHAIREFNPYKGVRLITYAVWWIRGYIQEYLMRQYSMVRIGTTQTQRKLFYQLQKEKDALDAMGAEPDYAMLSSRLGVDQSDIEQMTQRLSSRDLSLNAPVDDEGSSSLMDFQADGQAPPDEQLGHAEELNMLRENIDEIRSELNERELILLEERLLSDQPLTLQEIGEKYKITREAVRQTEARLLGKIKKKLLEKMSIDE